MQRKAELRVTKLSSELSSMSESQESLQNEVSKGMEDFLANQKQQKALASRRIEGLITYQKELVAKLEL